MSPWRAPPLSWPGAAPDPALPRFDVFHQQRHYIDVFNRGQEPFEYTAAAGKPWIVLSATQGTITKEERIWVTVDWRRAPAGSAGGSVKIAREGGESVTVQCRDPQSQATVTRIAWAALSKGTAMSPSRPSTTRGTFRRPGALGEDRRLRADPVGDDDHAWNRQERHASARLAAASNTRCTCLTPATSPCWPSLPRP